MPDDLVAHQHVLAVARNVHDGGAGRAGCAELAHASPPSLAVSVGFLGPKAMKCPMAPKMAAAMATKPMGWMIRFHTLTVVGTVPTCKRPRHMQRLPGSGRMLVACGDSGQADVIDLATRKSVARLPLGNDPEAFDLSLDGRTLYVSNEDDSALSFIDVASGKRLKSVPVGEEPEGVKVSPDGKRVYVTSEVANTVHVIDTASGEVLKNITVAKRPRRLAFTPDGAELWVTNELGSSATR